ncbi:Gfo/Idh/MocA family oxidoreductase [Nocardioides cavernae]|uniref:Gfo/Idh/MocA family oxidoreductase n=1 Tax=Nocardioides cavernae TaxID=1921566 RepID=A0ABR8NFC7_9ACTN|nr:Gfo/Idh/MocA family oxidoreductase [Nocardioides cavernae]MBD3926816.1 Gfo/Idh/MocA family oxidoreductase [Nocardioides cavernae]MBM7512538.1 putative dehydrogenase [Nocardioides cavernae]
MTTTPETPDGRRDLSVGMVGYAFMGAAHSHAWRTAPRFFDLPLRPRMAAVAGRDAEGVRAAAERLGWESTETSWQALVERDDIDLVDVCTPGHTHAEIVIAALEAGKHVLCEKPLANSVEEAEAMTRAAERAAADGVRAMVGFTYRRVPAISLARQLVAEGRLGTLHHVRAQYLQDWIVDPQAPLSWRLEKDKAGSGALGDIGAHIIDITQFITGDTITRVSGRLRTFVDERPLPSEHAGLSGTAGTGTGKVTVDDAATFLADFRGGAMGVFEATRFASGRKNAIRIEINGSRGSIAFDFEDMNVLHFFDGTEDAGTAGFRRILVTEAQHPYVGAWWPPGHVIGYEHGFIHQAVDLVRAIADGTDPTPTFADGLQVQRVLAAVETSSDNDSWQEIPA